VSNEPTNQRPLEVHNKFVEESGKEETHTYQIKDLYAYTTQDRNVLHMYTCHTTQPAVQSCTRESSYFLCSQRREINVLRHLPSTRVKERSEMATKAMTVDVTAVIEAL